MSVKALGVPDIRMEPGIIGAICRDDDPRAKYRNGARIKKVAEDKGGDVTKLGTLGTVLGSVYVPELGGAYFVEWDDKPRQSVFVVEYKIGGAL